MLFCVFAPDIGNVENGKPYFFMLLSSVIFIYTDFVYFSFFSSFKFYFNKKTHDSIQRATILGFFDQLKIGMGKGVVKMARTIGSVKGIKNPFHKRENTDESYDDMNRFAKTLMGSNNFNRLLLMPWLITVPSNVFN